MQRLGNALLICILVGMCFLLVQAVLNQGAPFNADNLKYSAVYQDLFWYHYPLSGWYHFSAIPHFFSTVGLYFIFYFFTKNFGAVFLLFECLDLLCLTLLLILISKAIYPCSYQYTMLPIILFVAYSLLVNFHTHGLLVSLTIPWIHFVTTLLSLFCLYILFRHGSKSDKRISFFLTGVAFFATVSDELFLPSLSIPLLLAALLSYLRQDDFPKKCVVGIGVGSSLGLLFNHLLPAHQQHLLSFKDIPIFVQTFPSFLTGYAAWFMSAWLLSYSAIIYFSLQSFRGKRLPVQCSLSTAATNMHTLRLFSYYLLMMPFCVLGAVLCLGMFKDELSARYLLNPLLFPIYAVLCYVFVWLGERIKLGYMFLLSLGLSSVLLLNLGFANNHAYLMFRTQWADWYPSSTACVDHFAAEYPTRYGLADYWDARVITLYSKRFLWVNQIRPEGHIHWWLNNKYWYLQDKDARNQLPRYSFVVFNNLFRPKAFIKHLGEPDKVISCQAAGFASKDKIFIYKQPQSISTFNQRFFQQNSDFFASAPRS